MKTDIFKLLADIPQKKVDQSAYTIKELLEAQDGRISESTMRKTAKKMVSSNKWESTWKKTPRGIVPAYRKK